MNRRSFLKSLAAAVAVCAVPVLPSKPEPIPPLVPLGYEHLHVDYNCPWDMLQRLQDEMIKEMMLEEDRKCFAAINASVA